jgi:serine/threonine protein kinase
LGEGGFGKVVLGKHKVNEELVAIKYVKKDITNGIL